MFNSNIYHFKLQTNEKCTTKIYEQNGRCDLQLMGKCFKLVLYIAVCRKQENLYIKSAIDFSNDFQTKKITKLNI